MGMTTSDKHAHRANLGGIASFAQLKKRARQLLGATDCEKAFFSKIIPYALTHIVQKILCGMEPEHDICKMMTHVLAEQEKLVKHNCRSEKTMHNQRNGHRC